MHAGRPRYVDVQFMIVCLLRQTNAWLLSICVLERRMNRSADSFRATNARSCGINSGGIGSMGREKL